MTSGEATPPSPQRNNNRAKPEPKHWLEYLIFIFVVTTAGGTGVAAWYTRQQWITAHDTLVVSERAFVSFDQPSFDMVRDPRKGWAIAINTPMNNSGNTRTRDLQFTVTCAKSTNHLLEPWGLFGQERLEHHPQVLPPKGKINGICGFTLDEVVQMSEAKIVGYLLGEITYHDVFTDARHVTQFAYESIFVHYEPKVNPGPNEIPARNLSMQWESRGKHNCADEDCPSD